MRKVHRKVRYICHGEPDCECWAYEPSDPDDADASCENCGHEPQDHLGVRKCQRCGEPLNVEGACDYCAEARNGS